MHLFCKRSQLVNRRLVTMIRVNCSSTCRQLSSFLSIRIFPQCVANYHHFFSLEFPNVALGKPAYQSTTYSSDNQAGKLLLIYIFNVALVIIKYKRSSPPGSSPLVQRIGIFSPQSVVFRLSLFFFFQIYFVNIF